MTYSFALARLRSRSCVRETAIVRRGLAIAIALLFVVGSGGCAFSRGSALRPESAATEAPGAWPRVLIAAQADIEQGHHADADRRLREFSAEYARTTEAVESTYWRAVFMLDPANTVATPREAASLLDRYLASRAPLQHRSEATVLQRIAKTLGAREAAASSPAPAPRVVADPTREAEIKALKDELELTKAELERIKKRLAPPPATPPPLPDTE